jgi:hypothetical protein
VFEPQQEGRPVTFARSAVEELIARQYGEVLGVAAVDVGADFFALGGHSLQAMQLLTALNDTFAVELQFGDLVENSTPRAIAVIIGMIIGTRAPRAQERLPLARREQDARTFIACGQTLFWRLAARQDLATYFNLRQALMLYGTLDVDALCTSIQALVDRHDSLRMHFLPCDDGHCADVQLIVAEGQTAPVSLLEPGGDAASNPQDTVRELLRQETQQPFDLLRGPLVRFTLVRFAPALHALLVTTHHLITDAWSNNVLKHELKLLYSARVRGAAATLPALPIGYLDYAHWNRALHQSQQCREQLAYWEQLFASLGSFEGYERAAEGTGRTPATRYTDLSVSDRDVMRIAQRSAAHNTTPYVFLQAIMHLALYSTFRPLQQLLVLSPATERHRPELQSSIGMYITIVGVVSGLAAAATFGEFIAQMKRGVHEALANAEARQFALYDLAKHRPTDFPLFVYNYMVMQNDCDWALDDLRVEPVMPPDDERPFVTMLELYHASFQGGLWGALAFNDGLISRQTVMRFAAHYRRILESVLSCAGDDEPIAALIGRSQ